MEKNGLNQLASEGVQLAEGGFASMKEKNILNQPLDKTNQMNEMDEIL